jgi:small-conductance mechanosensitive channel
MARMLMVWLGLSLLLIGARVASAQVPLPDLPGLLHGPQDQEPPRKEVPVPIVAAAIPVRAREAEAILRGAREGLVDRELSQIGALLPRLLEELAQSDPQAGILSNLSRRRELRDVLLTWGSLSERLRAWQRALTRHMDALEHNKQAVQSLDQLWTATLATLERQTDSPPPARLRALALRREIAEVQASLSDAGLRLFGLQERVDAARQSLDLRIELVQQTQLHGRGQLLRSEGIPIWGFADSKLPALEVHMEHVTRALRSFWSTYRRGLLLDAILLLLFVSGVRLLARRPPRQPDAQRLASNALGAPIRGALLIALIVARFAYPEARSAILDLLACGVLLTLLGLTSYVVGAPSARRVVRALTATLVAYRVLALLYLNDPWLDLALLLFTPLLLGALVWAIQVDRRGLLNAPGAHLYRATSAFLRIAIAGLSVTLLAGLFGYYELLAFLLEGFTFSLQWMLLAMAFTRILSALVEAALDAGHISKLASVGRHGSIIRGRALFTVNVLGVGLWLLVTLAAFEALEPLVAWLGRALSGSTRVGSWDVSFGDFGAFVLTMYLTVMLARTTAFFLDEDILPRMSLARGVPPTISRLSRYTILAAGFIFAVGAAGVDMSKVALFASALSVGIGFGMQNLINNFVSGLMLIFERPVRVGDTVQVGELIGVVQTIGIRSSTLRTAQGAEAIVPNSELIANRVINWTLSDPQRRVDIPIGVAYGTDPARVMSVLESAVVGAPGVGLVPKPTCLFVGFGESALNFELRVWAQRSEDWVDVRSAVAVAVHLKLADEGIEVPFPQRDLHVRSVDDLALRRLAQEPAAVESAAVAPPSE